MSYTRACRRRRFPPLVGVVALLALLLSLGTGPAQARTAQDPPAAVRVAFAALERGDWPAVHSLGSRLADPVSGKVLFWLRATRGDASVGFAEINAFLAANPDWPNRAALLRRAEEVLPEEKSARAVVSWFGEREPLTPYGRFRLARAYLDLGERERAGELARRSWRGGDLYYPDLERTFRATFASLLSVGDHRARLDALLWDGRETAARRLYDVVGTDRRALAEARLLLRRQKRNADATLAAVPPALRADPGLIYERVRWHRRRGWRPARGACSPRSSRMRRGAPTCGGPSGMRWRATPCGTDRPRRPTGWSATMRSANPAIMPKRNGWRDGLPCVS